MNSSSFVSTFGNALTVIVGITFFAVTTVGLVSPASAAAPVAVTKTVAR